jgi:hypothetical protein
MKMTIEDILNPNDYASNESNITASDQQTINSFIANIKINNTSQTIINLQRIQQIITDNKTNLDVLLNNTNIAKNILQNEVNNLTSESTLKNLYLENIDPSILSISSAQFNEYYNQVQELNYRLNICSYRTKFIKDQQSQLDSQYELINKYIIAIQEVNS